MKFINLLLLTSLLACGSNTVSNSKLDTPPSSPLKPCEAQKEFCEDKMVLLSSTDLTKGFSCPINTNITFPSYFSTSSVLVLCQCKR